MIPELGHFALVVALSFSILLSIIPIIGVRLQSLRSMQLARPLALGQCFFVLLSFSILVYAFYMPDFSVHAVASHSHSMLPMPYKIGALWGGHEGSLLLWILILSAWMVLCSVYSRFLPLPLVAFMLAILGMLSVGFLLFLLMTSNPFVRLLPYFPIEGRDLNPLLQDPALMIHPPILYIGYAGFSIPFAFSLAALYLGKCESIWLRWLRIWVLLAFGFLTVGIALGSWWAYYELGWGGWWFWDPVENVSLMPWLMSIGFIHVLFGSEKQKKWIQLTLGLGLMIFIIILMGLCLVRSGVLSSVHAFASDPARGLFMLIFLGLVILVSSITYASRIKYFKTLSSLSSKTFFLSRETFILVSTVFLMVSAFTLLLGTLFPFLYEWIRAQKISVGFPYFNAVFIPIMLPVLFLIPLGPMTRWGQNDLKAILAIARLPFCSALILTLILLFWISPMKFSMGLGLFLSIWIILGTLKIWIAKKTSLGAWGMALAHIGIAISVLGISMVSAYQIEKEVKIKPGDVVLLGEYSIQFLKTDIVEGPNYMSYKAVFQNQYKKNKPIILLPEKRFFLVQNSVMTETAIDSGLFRDIYIALGDKLTEGAWTVRMCYKPFVRFIWIGALMMALGALLAAIAKRQVIIK